MWRSHGELAREGRRRGLGVGWLRIFERNTNRPTPAAFVVALVGVAIALELIREVAISAWGTIWAEDGSVFLADALNKSFPRNLINPYGGYLHVVPRVVAELAAFLPLAHAALVFSAAWACVVASAAAFVYFASADVFRSPSTRLALSGLVALLPAAGSELLGNVTNLHFYLVFTCFWALIWRSETRSAVIARTAVVVVTTLSDPLVLLFAPLALRAALVRRTRCALAIPLAFATGLAIQLAAILASEPPQRLTRFDPSDLLPLFALRVTGSLLVGDRFLDDVWFAFGRAFAYGALAAVLLACAAAVARSARSARFFVGTCAAYSAIFFVAPLAGRGTSGMRPGTDEATWHLAGARFTLAPILFLATALLTIVDRSPSSFPGSAWFNLQRIAPLVIATLIIANFSFESERSLGPRWRPSLNAARDRCEAGGERARVPVAPAPFGFALVSTCSRLR
jgi:hypothetical protein